jgi:hypothetical protein
MRGSLDSRCREAKAPAFLLRSALELVGRFKPRCIPYFSVPNFVTLEKKIVETFGQRRDELDNRGYCLLLFDGLINVRSLFYNLMSLASNIINRILEFSADSYGLLYHCALVNWKFNFAASRLLYFRVVLSPLFQPVLNLRDTGAIPVSGNARCVSGKHFPGAHPSFAVIDIANCQPMISGFFFEGNIQFLLCFDRKKYSSRLHTRSQW